MDRHVVRTLEKSGVNREERLQTLCSQAARKKRRVFFGDADIEITARVRLRKMRKPGAAWHRGCNGDQLLICLREFRQCLSKNFRICRGGRRRGLAALDLIFSEAVELVGLFQRRREALEAVDRLAGSGWRVLLTESLGRGEYARRSRALPRRGPRLPKV